MKALLALTDAQLRAVSHALASKRLVHPVSAIALARVVDAADDALATELSQVVHRCRGPEAAAEALALMLAARSAEAKCEPELVWSGPDQSHQTRDTAVVVRELFAMATREVLISGFVVVLGREVFQVLAERMDAQPNLVVRLFLNVDADEARSDEARLLAFARDFASRQWPGHRLPHVYYDPRSLAERRSDRASLHAKCVVVDRSCALITSANFTPHAQQRNVELGALLRDEGLSTRVVEQFEALLKHGHFVRLPGI